MFVSRLLKAENIPLLSTVTILFGRLTAERDSSTSKEAWLNGRVRCRHWKDGLKKFDCYFSNLLWFISVIAMCVWCRECYNLALKRAKRIVLHTHMELSSFWTGTPNTELFQSEDSSFYVSPFFGSICLVVWFFDAFPFYSFSKSQTFFGLFFPSHRTRLKHRGWRTSTGESLCHRPAVRETHVPTGELCCCRLSINEREFHSEYHRWKSFLKKDG